MKGAKMGDTEMSFFSFFANTGESIERIFLRLADPDNLSFTGGEIKKIVGKSGKAEVSASLIKYPPIDTPLRKVTSLSLEPGQITLFVEKEQFIWVIEKKENKGEDGEKFNRLFSLLQKQTN